LKYVHFPGDLIITNSDMLNLTEFKHILI